MNHAVFVGLLPVNIGVAHSFLFRKKSHPQFGKLVYEVFPVDTTLNCQIYSSTTLFRCVIVHGPLAGVGPPHDTMS